MSTFGVMVPMLRCRTTKRWRPKAWSVHRIGVVHRLKTMSSTGAIGHACAEVVPCAGAPPTPAMAVLLVVMRTLQVVTFL